MSDGRTAHAPSDRTHQMASSPLISDRGPPRVQPSTLREIFMRLHLSVLLTLACTGNTPSASDDTDTVSPSDTDKPGQTPDIYTPDNGPTHEGGTRVPVDSETDILAAIAAASPGDVITIEPGEYDFNQLIRVTADGTAAERIFLRAETLGDVTLNLRHIENFKIYGKYWIFENLVVRGACTSNTSCEHAFHIVGDADDLIFRTNEVVDFASHVKLNGEVVDSGPAKAFPDRIMFIENLWYNTKYVANNAPHNVLNLDGGKSHVVRGNIFGDYGAPASLPKSASAVYPKASTLGMLVEQNLIVCEKNLGDGETVRGIQLGDGAPASICDGDDDQDGIGDCIENGQNQEALIRNNVILNCDNGGSSAGIMVSSDRESKILHNTVLSTGKRSGAFYVGHPDHDTYWNSNLLENGFNTDYAKRTLVESDNAIVDATTAASLFTNPRMGDLASADSRPLSERVTTSADAPWDFCGHPRGETADLGAIEYSATEQQAECFLRVQEMFDRLP